MKQVAVVGAGVIGLSCAWQLAKAGAKVTLLDTQTPPTGASAAAAGWLSATVYPRSSRLNQFFRESLTLYPAFVASVEKESGHHVGFKQIGHLRLGSADDADRAFNHDLALTASIPPDLQHFCAHNLTPGTLCRWNGGSSTLAPRALLEALWVAGQRIGVVFIEARVIDIQGHTVVLPSGSLAFDSIVVAGGYVSGGLKDLLGAQCRVRPKRGEAIEVTLPAGLLLPTVLETEDLYIVPRQLTPTLYIGTLDAWVDDLTLNPQAPAELLARACRWLPRLTGASVIAQHVGVRTVPLNEGPIIGQHHDNEHIYMALGFAGGGFKSAPLAACAVTRGVMQDSLPKNHAFFAE